MNIVRSFHIFQFGGAAADIPPHYRTEKYRTCRIGITLHSLMESCYTFYMENHKKKLSKTHKKLGIILAVSVLLLLGITVYALHWEELAAVSFEERVEAVKEKVSEWSEQRGAGHDSAATEDEKQEEFECEIAYMSRQFPALMKIADAQEDWIAVPLISQEEVGYQTGCELVSAAMVLNYYGIEASPEDVYAVIKKTADREGNASYGEDPDVYFIGDPRTSHAFGCYVHPLTDAMNQLLGEDWQAVNVSDSELEYLVENYLEQGIPIIIWATINMSNPQEGDSWMLSDGRMFQWIAGEHCLVMVGSDEEYYYFNDPNHAGEVIGYEKALVQERYEQLGKQAIIISR